MNKKIYLVTGVSSGLGKAIAETIIESGDFVIGTFRKQAQVDNFDISYKEKAKGILLDVTNMEAIERQVTYIKDTYGKIDFLVNNAGIGFAGAIEEASIEEVRQIFEANFFGALKLSQAVLPIMRAQKSGHIVQISSHAGVKSTAGFGIYNASKFALEGFSEALALELEPLGIKVTIVEPGPFRTNFAGHSLHMANKEIEDYAATAGSFRKKLKSVHNKQEGDPVKAAKIIIDYINADNRALRLPLGTIPIKTIGIKIDSLKNDLETNKDLAAKAVF